VLVVNGRDGPKGLVELKLIADVSGSDRTWMTASDSMVPFASLRPADTWGQLVALLERCGVSQVPVLDSGGEVLGWVGDRELHRALIGRQGAPP
jgi:predicted transcriptional regulator